jgi:hypothetical protein
MGVDGRAEAVSGAEFDDVVYGVYVRERDIMEIPASSRLFMADTVTWQAMPCTPENERRSSRRPHDHPVETAITRRPFHTRHHGLPW